MSCYIKKILTPLAFALLPLMVKADTGMIFTGNLVIPLCTVNNNSQVTIPFGDVEIQTLVETNTPYHIQNITVPIVCPYTIGQPLLTIDSSSIHNAAQGVIQTSKYSEGLVIYLRQNDGTTALPLGVETNVKASVSGTDTSRNLNIKAGVGRINTLDVLTPGEFTSSVTLKMRYQ